MVPTVLPFWSCRGLLSVEYSPASERQPLCSAWVDKPAYLLNVRHRCARGRAVVATLSGAARLRSTGLYQHMEHLSNLLPDLTSL